MLFRSTVAALIALCSVGSAGAAQASAPQGPDSATTILAFGVIADALPQHLAWRLWSTETSPWIISVPPDTGRIKWSTIERELRRLVRARDTSAVDDRRSVFRVESFAVRGDSVSIEFYVGGRFKCPDAWRGSGTWYAGAARLGWGVPRGASVETAFEDSAGCRQSGRPHDGWY